MDLQKIVLAYFLIGATVWAGGAIAYDDAGVATFFVQVNNDSVQGNEETAGNISDSGGPIQEAAQGVTGGIIAVWNLLTGLAAFLFWPISTLVAAGAPVEVTAIVGGAPTVTFYGALFRVLRRS